MTNHVHLVAVPTHAASLACGIGRAHYDYTRALHQRWGGHGHLWQNRFFSCPLDGDHLWTTLRYVDLNPVRAGMVDDALAYEWSSARAHVEGRDGHTATLLPDGTVLITGGRQINFEDVGASDPRLDVCNGFEASVIGAAEIYDPDSGTFTSLTATSAALFERVGTLVTTDPSADPPIQNVLLTGSGRPSPRIYLDHTLAVEPAKACAEELAICKRNTSSHK